MWGTEEKKTIKKLVTHNGSFHADDIFACATLSLVFEKHGEQFEIIRTRDKEIIDAADYVFDVGHIYDEATNRFDHHQPGGAGTRPNGIEYSSFGLVWKKFGLELCGVGRVWDTIDKNLVSAVDAHDNGFELVTSKHEVFPYLMQSAMYSMRPTWKEGDTRSQEYFLKAVSFAKEILNREIIWANDVLVAERIVITTYQETQDKRIIVLDGSYPYESILNHFPEPLLVIHKGSHDNHWSIKAMREGDKTFKTRINFPSSWGGLHGQELARISGVDDAVFCHRGLFIAVTDSKEGAIALAKKALEINLAEGKIS